MTSSSPSVAAAREAHRSATGEFGVQSRTAPPALDGDTCFDCGGEVVIDENGVSNHLTPDGDIDFDADADHVALSDEQYADINGDLAGPHLDETAYRAS